MLMICELLEDWDEGNCATSEYLEEFANDDFYLHNNYPSCSPSLERDQWPNRRISNEILISASQNEIREKNNRQKLNFCDNVVTCMS